MACSLLDGNSSSPSDSRASVASLTPAGRVLPTASATPLDQIPTDVTDEWKPTRVVRIEGTDRPDYPLFTIRLPENWAVRNARIGADSWGGALIGPEFEISFTGGGYAVSSLLEIVGGSGIQKDHNKAEQHVIEQQRIEGREATLVRPRKNIGGATGMLIGMPAGRILFTSHNLSREQQTIAYAIFHTVTP